MYSYLRRSMHSYFLYAFILLCKYEFGINIINHIKKIYYRQVLRTKPLLEGSHATSYLKFGTSRVGETSNMEESALTK